MREAVKVMVRCRPMSQNEIDRSKLFSYLDSKSVIAINKQTHQIGLKKGTVNQSIKYFSYDHVFD